MLWLLPRPRARIKRLNAQAEALISELGIDAYAEARRRELEASSEAFARDWGRVARAIVKRTSLDALHKTPKGADVTLGESVAPSEPRSRSELRLLDRLNGAVLARPQQFRVQFVGAARGREPLILKEVGIEAADVSTAVVAAASLGLPPRTNGLHILDREGREVFARDRAKPRLRLLGRPKPQAALSTVRSLALSQWRRTVETTHLLLNYVRNAEVQRRISRCRSGAGAWVDLIRSRRSEMVAPAQPTPAGPRGSGAPRDAMSLATVSLAIPSDVAFCGRSRLARKRIGSG